MTLDGMGKFRNFLGSGRAVARLSDQICMEHKLSVIEKPQHTGVSYNKWLGDKAASSQRDTLRNVLDEVLAQKPGSFEALLAAMQQKGWEIKRGKQVSFRGPREKRFKRLDTLGEAYTEETLRAVLAGERVHIPGKRRKTRRTPQETQVSLLVDVQAKLQAGKGAGYATEETREIAFQLMQSVAIMVVFQGTQSMLTKGVLRGGGDTRFLVTADISFMWLLSIPLGYFSSFVWHMSPFWIYFFMKIDYIIKTIWCIMRLKGDKWIRKLAVSSMKQNEPVKQNWNTD